MKGAPHPASTWSGILASSRVTRATVERWSRSAWTKRGLRRQRRNVRSLRWPDALGRGGDPSRRHRTAARQARPCCPAASREDGRGAVCPPTSP
jgi:hypothetical protein